jgi:hypothetical protein
MFVLPFWPEFQPLPPAFLRPPSGTFGQRFVTLQRKTMATVSYGSGTGANTPHVIELSMLCTRSFGRGKSLTITPCDH